MFWKQFYYTRTAWQARGEYHKWARRQYLGDSAKLIQWGRVCVDPMDGRRLSTDVSSLARGERHVYGMGIRNVLKSVTCSRNLRSPIHNHTINTKSFLGDKREYDCFRSANRDGPRWGNGPVRSSGGTDHKVIGGTVPGVISRAGASQLHDHHHGEYQDDHEDDTVYSRRTDGRSFVCK
jgi:hypothetical protein